MSECKYKKGGSKKYVLTEFYYDKLKFRPPYKIDTPYCVVDVDGRLFINSGYEWDGPSGPAIDTDNFMDGSLVHDVLYQLIREGYFGGFLKQAWYRLKADNEMWRQTKKDKMNPIRRGWCWLGVRIGGVIAGHRWRKMKS